MNTNIDVSPVYQIQNWNTEQEATPACPSLVEIGEWLEDGTIILWTHASISVGSVQSKTIEWHSGQSFAELNWAHHLVELRAFNKRQEWRLWVSEEGIRGRKLMDERVTLESGSAKALDVELKLRGNIASVAQQFIFQDSQTLFLKTRNYLAQNAAKMTGYQDVRFVELIQKGGRK